MDEKRVELASEFTAKYGEGAVPSELDMVNSRHMTNIGTFRAYCTAYLRSLEGVAQNMTLQSHLRWLMWGIYPQAYVFIRVQALLC